MQHNPSKSSQPCLCTKTKKLSCCPTFVLHDQGGEHFGFSSLQIGNKSLDDMEEKQSKAVMSRLQKQGFANALAGYTGSLGNLEIDAVTSKDTVRGFLYHLLCLRNLKSHKSSFLTLALENRRFKHDS